MSTPHTLIHIGYPKAASTLLQAYFSEHPQVYYSGEVLNNYKLSGEIEIAPFALAPGQTHLVISEEQLSVWQGNLDIVGVKFRDYNIAEQQQKTATQLKLRFPGAKILIITRGFQSAFLSMYSQYVSIGGILKFEDFEQQVAHIFAAFYNYNFVVKTYRQAFGHENVLVLPFEMLQHNPTGFIEHINRFSNLPETDFDVLVKNASLGKEEIESYRKLSMALYLAIQWLPYSLKQKIYGLYVYLLYSRRLGPIARLLSGKPATANISKQTLMLFNGNASTLRTETFYQPYYKEYLL